MNSYGTCLIDIVICLFHLYFVVLVFFTMAFLSLCILSSRRVNTWQGVKVVKLPREHKVLKSKEESEGSKTNLYTYNVRGLRDKIKRNRIFEYLRTNIKGIVFLQETHSVPSRDGKERCISARVQAIAKA